MSIFFDKDIDEDIGLILIPGLLFFSNIEFYERERKSESAINTKW